MIASKPMNESRRARGSNRGGCGGGYEQTDPDYEEKKLKRLKQEYLDMDPMWRSTFLASLSRFEQNYVTGKIQPH